MSGSVGSMRTASTVSDVSAGRATPHSHSSYDSTPPPSGLGLAATAAVVGKSRHSRRGSRDDGQGHEDAVMSAVALQLLEVVQNQQLLMTAMNPLGGAQANPGASDLDAVPEADGSEPTGNKVRVEMC